MNGRIKELRNQLGLTLEEFGSRIGMSKSGLSKIERNVSGISDQTIRSICREFEVNEAWLRTGEGDMFDQSSSSILNRVSAEYNLSSREQAMISAFLELDASDRSAIMRYVDKLVEKLAPPSPTGIVASSIAAARDYLDMVSEEKNTEENSSTSAG